MKPVAARCDNPGALLAGADFADSFVIEVAGQGLDIDTAARRVAGRAPGWTRALLRLRNALVRPFGLRTPDPYGPRAGRIGAFPVLSRAADRIVLGLDDRHLDFRLAITLADLGGGRQTVTAATVVRTHNLPGRAYLALIKPFHRRIVPAMPMQAGRP